jgi:hypothetical protein
VRLDRKLLLIAPTIVLGFVVAGMIYAAVQLRVLSNVGTTWKDRSDFIASVERGDKKLDQRQSLGLLRYSLDVEAKRTEAIVATRDLLIILSAIALLSCGALALGIRTVPREHWPRFGRDASP